MFKFKQNDLVKFDSGLLKGAGKIIGANQMSLLGENKEWIVEISELKSNLGEASEFIDKEILSTYPFSALLIHEGNLSKA